MKELDVSACTDKIRYRTKGQASDAAKRSRALYSDGDKMRIYSCDDCGGFHLTSMTPVDHRYIRDSKRRNAT